MVATRRDAFAIRDEATRLDLRNRVEPVDPSYQVRPRRVAHPSEEPRPEQLTECHLRGHDAYPTHSTAEHVR